MSPKEIRRKRGRPPATSPPASPRRPNSRISSERRDFDTKRRRDKSPLKFEQENEDEFSETDEVGETKIDSNGRLLGGREYKVATFKLPEYGDQELMLAMDPSKILGYRDSYLFFQRNPSLKRVRINEEEKNMLVGMGLLIAWFKGREVAVVTARSVFKRFGSRIVQKGKHIIDDYFENREVEAEENYQPIEEAGEDASKFGESYFNEAALDNKNWIYHAALATRGFNAHINERRAARSAFYDIHSDVNQVPLKYQPESCQFEFIKNQDDQQEATVEYRSSTNDKFSGFRGVGRDILDSDLDCVLSSLPEDEQQKTREALVEKIPIQEVREGEDEKYPISLMDGQYQHAFPVHQARFNYPIPKIPEPSIIFDTAQSLSAQQYYLGVVYQTVNQFADPRRQHPASVRPGPSTFSPQPQQMMPAVSPAPPVNIQKQPTPNLCHFKVSLSQVCGRPVGQPGQLCQAHTEASKTMADHASAPPPPTSSYVDKCTDCHQTGAPDSIYASLNQERVTESDVLVKCSNCTRKYHPICANLTTPRQAVAVESYPWLCPECKVCCACKTAGDEANLMICDGCDRGWHTGCCSPAVEHIPEGEWLCQLCAKCHGCSERGMKNESQYTHVSVPKSEKNKYPVYLATYCGPCAIDFHEDRLCPVCLKTYSEEENDEEDNEMVACDTCDHWVHTRCDASLTNERYQLLCDDETAKYSCPMCENRVTPTSNTEAALKGKRAPSGICVGILGGKVKTRGVVYYKDIKIGVPEIDGSGISEIVS
ncbi:unnamed protein product [Rhizopus stolonifer]